MPVRFSCQKVYKGHKCENKISFFPLQVKERVRDSMYALGLPILQGAISTILGVIGLALAPSYIFFTFFKMVLLVIVLGAIHGLILLPVLLSFLGPGTCCNTDTTSSPPKVKKSAKAEKVKKPPLPPPNTRTQPTQTYLEEGGVEVSMKIPRPKHSGGKHHNSSGASASAASSTVDFNQSDSSAFHSDNYLQAASKNKKRRSSAHGIKLHEMYTNRAFQD